MFWFGKFDEKFIWAKNCKGERDRKVPSFGEGCMDRLVAVSFLGDDMTYKGQTFIS